MSTTGHSTSGTSFADRRIPKFSSSDRQTQSRMGLVSQSFLAHMGNRILTERYVVGVPHCAIMNPDAPEDCLPRESIEVVAFVYSQE